MLMESPELARAAHAGLHFVAEKKDVVAAAEGLYPAQIGCGQGHDAAFALHYLHQHGCGGRGDGGLQSRQIARGHLHKAFWQRGKALTQTLAPRGRQGAQGAPVKTTTQ